MLASVTLQFLSKKILKSLTFIFTLYEHKKNQNQVSNNQWQNKKLII